MFNSNRNQPTSQWQDPPPKLFIDNTQSTWDNPPQTTPDLHPGIAVFLDSVFALAFKATLFLSIAILAGGLALSQPFERIGQMMLWGVLLVSGVLGFSFLLNALTMNLKQLYSIQLALRELRRGEDINGDGYIGMPPPNYTPSNPPLDTTQTEIERQIELIPTNKGTAREFIMVGEEKIDRRDFIAFLHRAWETNGEAEKGLARVYWCGGRLKSNNQYAARYRFERTDDGTTQECSREIYDAIMKKLETLGEIEGRGNGWSGRLRRDPKEWLGQAQWL